MKTSFLPVTRTIKTRNRPIQVFCDDYKDYVVKSNQGDTPAYRMIKEYLGSHFAQLWELPTPQPAIVKVKPEHLTGSGFADDPVFYDNPCFASVYSKNADDWDNLIKHWKKYDIAKLQNPTDLLKILLFDLWLGNEDRFHANHNLLLLSHEGKFTVQVIDHESIFNAYDSNNNRMFFDSGLMFPQYHILQSRSVLRVLGKPRNLKSYLDGLGENFNTFTNFCAKAADGIIDEMPKEWHPERADLKRYIHQVVMDNNWIERVYDRFREEVAKAIY